MTAANRVRLLEEAATIVNGERNVTYDEPEDNFARIGALWSAYLGRAITPADVAAMNVLQKVGRLMHRPTHRDSWVDIAGYAACGADVADAMNEWRDEAAMPDENEADEPPSPPPALRAAPKRPAPTSVNADNEFKVNGKWDWAAIGAIASQAQERGDSIANTLRDQLRVTPDTSRWMTKRCRELGYLAADKPWTPEPIARTSFDPERVRAAAAAAL